MGSSLSRLSLSTATTQSQHLNISSPDTGKNAQPSRRCRTINKRSHISPIMRTTNGQFCKKTRQTSSIRTSGGNRLHVAAMITNRKRGTGCGRFGKSFYAIADVSYAIPLPLW